MAIDAREQSYKSINEFLEYQPLYAEKAKKRLIIVGEGDIKQLEFRVLTRWEAVKAWFGLRYKIGGLRGCLQIHIKAAQRHNLGP
jgi:hypothetical protein